MQWELYNPIKRWTDDGGATREGTFPLCCFAYISGRCLDFSGERRARALKNVSLGFFDLEIGLVTDIF